MNTEIKNAVIALIAANNMKAATGIIGKWDGGGRYFINEEFCTESSRAVRTPSRAWPHSEYKHVFTRKFAKQLLAKLVEA